MSDKWDKWYYYTPAGKQRSSTGAAEGTFLDLVFPLAILGVVVAFGIVAWQIYIYLRTGNWHSLSVISALQWCGVEWAFFPRDWAGVHTVLSIFPLSLASALGGVVPAWIYVTWAEKLR